MPTVRPRTMLAPPSALGRRLSLRLPWVDDPDVTLTDYLLAAETAWFARTVLRRPTHRPWLRRWTALFFGAAGVASVAGGTVHGFFGGEETLGHRLLWPTSMLAIGVGALALVGIGAEIGCRPVVARRLVAVGSVAAVVYAAVVLVVSHDFVVAVAAYLPATCFLLVLLLRRYAARREPAVLLGVAAILLAVVAAGVQRAKVALHPRYADHNALYHLIQAISFACFYRGAAWLVEHEPMSE